MAPPRGRVRGGGGVSTARLGAGLCSGGAVRRLVALVVVLLGGAFFLRALFAGTDAGVAAGGGPAAPSVLLQVDLGSRTGAGVRATTPPPLSSSSSSSSSSAAAATPAPADGGCAGPRTTLTSALAAAPESLFEVSVFERDPSDPAVWVAEVRPRADFCCQAGAPSTDRVCGGHSAFAALVQGPSVHFTGNVTNDNEPSLESPVFVARQAARWVVRVRVPPLLGRYKVTVFIEIFGAPGLYEEWGSRQDWQRAMAALSTDEIAARYSTRNWHRPLATGGVQMLVVTAADVDAMPRASTLPWCTRDAGIAPTPGRAVGAGAGLPTFMPGYWVGSPGRGTALAPFFVPFGCRLRRLKAPPVPDVIDGMSTADVAGLRSLLAHDASADAVADLRARVAGKWIAVYGDSNGRNIWGHLCSALGASGAQVLANISALPESHRPVDFVCYGPDLLLSVGVWWPTRYPQLHERITDTAAQMVERAKVISPDINPALLAKPLPDRVLILLGSHDTHATVSLSTLVRTLLSRASLLQQGDPDDCGDGRLLFASVYATDAVVLGESAQHHGMVKTQNNPRMRRTNDGTRALMRSCPLADLYAVSEAPCLASWYNNAVHPPEEIYDASIDVLLNYL
jgi:hypothetical protein